MRGLIAVALLVLMGCATPPGKLTDDDMASIEVTINKPLSEAYAGLQDNARQCGGLIDQYSPQWYPGADSAKIDLFLKGMGGGPSDWAAGIIDLSQDGQRTVAKFGIQKVYSNPMFRKKMWWAESVHSIAKEIEQGLPPSCK